MSDVESVAIPSAFGPFVVERELGRGGMGAVYAAVVTSQDGAALPESSLEVGRRVAVKVSTGELDERDRRNFLEEAALCARVSHPSVVQILGSGTFDDGRPYIVMPLLEGETLASRVARGRLPHELAMRLFGQLGGAVAALHEAGIVHRDIKLENVMYLASAQRLVLLDLGIAREIDSPAGTTTRMQLVRGTPGVMAPERFFGVRASASSDVYELAVVLYAMLTGRLPWENGSDPESRLRPRHPSELGVDLPIGLGHVLLEALSTKPDRRPTARELEGRVRALEGSPVAARDERGDTALAAMPLPFESPAPRARSVPAPADAGDPPWRGPRVGWLALGIAGALALAFGASRGSRLRATQVVQASATSATLAEGPEAEPTSSPATSEPTDVGSASSEALSPRVTDSARDPPTPDAPSSSSRAAIAASTPAHPPAAAGMPWCTKLVELYCSPAALKLAGGEARCATQRAQLATSRELSDSTKARGEASCRDAIPAMQSSLRSPQSSEAPEDLPWCKRLVGAYCNPDVKNSVGGEGLCAQAQNAWGARLQALPPAERAERDATCARVLPAAVQAMREHVRTLGPGTAASARLGSAFSHP